jgi:hypothetical protein
MMRAIQRRLAKSGASGDAGFTLTELLIVLAFTMVVLVLVLFTTASIVKHDSKNLIRQQRVEGVRIASIWLSDALAFTAQPPLAMTGNVARPAVERATVSDLQFTTALPVEGVADEFQSVSRVRVVLGEECWTGVTAGQAGVLHRCLQTPLVDGGQPQFCDFGASDCPDELFEDLILARGVVNNELFTYFAPGAANGSPSVTGDAALAAISAVEFNVTVGSPDGVDDGLTATVFKRYSIGGWSNS